MCVRFFYFPTAAGWMLLPCCKSQRLSLHTRWKDSTKNKVESRKSIGPIGPWHAISLTNDSHHVTELDQEGPPDQSQSSRDPKHPTKGIKNSPMPFYLLLLFISRLHFFFFPTRDLVIFHQTQHHPPVIGYIFFISCLLLLLVKPNQSNSWIIQRIPINSLLFFNPPTKKDLFFSYFLLSPDKNVSFLLLRHPMIGMSSFRTGGERRWRSFQPPTLSLVPVETSRGKVNQR